MNSIPLDILCEQYFDVKDDLTELSVYLKPHDYQMFESGPWLFFNNDSGILPTQGWKGHLSTVLENSKITLETAVSVFKQFGCVYKVSRNEGILKILNNIHAPIQTANKFITFYPK
ncbi:hypothetical protein NIE88_16405 [Sporolactobacillus shoreicorticis]|uniref:RamC N-terminal domain-containing protein n=1 Tax=Sporolactobacillus shoreicorticis TaxID=1923877 RepID=A0ABW5S6H9_9BACL|nr:hypothetical protein [Sporolactobacillus shoreicorticis]MCO7127353.1 hypothetical protein [Sporolactobacillus shoreicorticis]